ncbi:sensor histidine kinase [Haloechinothrix halophila]|uniref:sensor histidine kinase n=1 Tax=Haloechinothrix halophila TaxID=1069073 RepID=UPI000417865D|nr:nitrate- and nitrite sensing domain-containing protein [Haloechinothrix halophila]
MTGSGQQQVPVERLLGEEPGRGASWRSWLGKLLAWRDWKLPVKLAAVTLVPLVIAVVLGASTLSSQISRSDSYQRIDSLMVLTGEVGGLLNAVQRERTETVARLTDSRGSNKALRQAREDVDAAIDPVTSTATRAVEHDKGIVDAVTRSETVLNRLPALREDVSAGKLGPVEAIKEYSAITDALLQLASASVARVSDEAIGGTPRAVLELAAAREEVSKQRALVGLGAVRGSLAPSELTLVRTWEVRIEDRLANFVAVAAPAERELYTNTLSKPSSQARARSARAVLGELGVPSDRAIAELSPREWQDASGRVSEQLGQVADRLTAKAVATSNGLVSDATTGVVVLAVLLGLALLVALLVVIVITRQLLHSLRVLRTSAMTVAEERLPEEVRRIQDGTDPSTSIEPVPVTATDEVGEVARAFDAVHQQALRLAAEQANMRSAYGGMFVNLSRRSQSLVQRQLQLIERLERDEEDADQLATLFQLDHLATRMRRNNENLMMLSGAETGRRSGRPVSTADVLRAAVSEIEQYQRVVVQSPPTTKVVGHAASDLMRLLAELLDNATAFSPPETQVTVTTSVTNGGAMTIDVLDHGIGMSESEFAEANARMGEASEMTMVTSRRMGLFVVGRLASKHGFGVTLQRGTETEGVMATVAVPPELIIGAGGGPLTSEIPMITEAAAARTPDARTKQVISGAKTAPESDVEISGTALFTPITDDSEEPARRPDRTPRGGPTELPRRVPASANGTGGKSGTSSNGSAGSNGNTGGAESTADGGTKTAQNGASSGATNGGGKNGAGKTGTRNGGGTSAANANAGTDLPSGSALFKPGTSPLSDWWQAAAAEPAPPKEPVPSRSESTPIFDEMLSVWFRTTGDAAEQEPSTESEAKHGSWTFAADENWRTVAEIAKKSSASSFTEAGLPRRQRGERLLPGSAAGEQVSEKPSRSQLGRADLPDRDPNDVRGRLSSFQRGLSRGKHRVGKHNAPEAQDSGQSPEGTSGKHETGARPSSDTSSTSPNGQATGSGTPSGSDAASGHGSGHGSGNGAATGSRNGSSRGAAKGSGAAKKPGTGSGQGSTKGAGSGKRSSKPTANSAKGADSANGRGTGSDTGTGARNGQRTAAKHGAKSQGAKSHGAKPAATPGAAGDKPETPRNGAQPPSPEESTAPVPDPLATKDNEPATDIWDFSRDSELSDVDAMASMPPPDFTESGLPRRRRGAQLLPGSATATTKTAPVKPPQPDRDPNAMRGRLSSFQQGVRRGRDSTNQPSESTSQENGG